MLGRASIKYDRAKFSEVILGGGGRAKPDLPPKTEKTSRRVYITSGKPADIYIIITVRHSIKIYFIVSRKVLSKVIFPNLFPSSYNMIREKFMVP